MTRYRYKSEVLAQLWMHGVQPRETTPPELVHEFVSDLYRYELRMLRDRLVRQEIPKVGYYDRVVALRRKYPLVSLKPFEWLLGHEAHEEKGHEGHEGHEVKGHEGHEGHEVKDPS